MAGKKSKNWLLVACVQLVVLGAFAGAYLVLPRSARTELSRAVVPSVQPAPVAVSRVEPLRVTPLYDDPEVVSDEELAAVLKKIRPKFPVQHMKPNYVEHALRAWGVDAEFTDPEVRSGVQLRDFLIDYGTFVTSWGNDARPMLEDKPEGVAVRWGKEVCGSVHHDHALACLTETGVPLDQPVFTPARRNATIDDMLQAALRDFRLDEKEVEWSAMAFGLWLPPQKTWTTADGRELSFDLLAERLMRGDDRFGVCSGTHRVYSLVLLLRLDQEFDILSTPVYDRVHRHLGEIRDLIAVSQFEDGHWPSDWSRGKAAVESPIEDENHARVIATGHHLEWLAIAPEELHPPREQILKAADWVIANTTSQPDAVILEKYTFYSHVGAALALWRDTRPATFWKSWTAAHPGYESQAPEKN